MKRSRAREKSEKLVFVGYSEGKEWEVWRLVFNRGTKLKKPVKCIFGRAWKTSGPGHPFDGMYHDDASESAAEEWFASRMAEYGGQIENRTTTLIKKLAELGYQEVPPSGAAHS